MYSVVEADFKWVYSIYLILCQWHKPAEKICPAKILVSTPLLDRYWAYVATETFRNDSKRLPCMEKLTYHQRLSILESESLELSRVLADLIFTYKLVFGLTDASLHDFLYHASTNIDEVTIINYTFQPANWT